MPFFEGFFLARPAAGQSCKCQVSSCKWGQASTPPTMTGCCPSDYPRLGDVESSTRKGLNGVATAAGAGDATPLGLEIILWDGYPG
jgi:hypothetical protein